MSDPLDALQAYRERDPTQVVILYKAVGNASIMKKTEYRITAANKFQAVIRFLRKELGLKPGDSLFTYINLAFAPAPDDTVANLYKCFAVSNKLIVNYSLSAAWG
ncbi:autophagy protein 12 [Trametopsis cervina]|nr:autophagy protein 12 [Trametopsis cervina]